MSNKTQEKDKTSLVFIKDVASYFMDFLETDFHKRRNPKRSVKLRDSDGLLVGVSLNKYPSFNKIVWRAVLHAFDKDSLSKIGKGVYRSDIPKNLLDLVNLQIKKISSKQISNILKAIEEETEKLATLYRKEYDKALDATLDATSKIIKSELVLPFVDHLEKPIESLNLGDENVVYLMEEELTSVLTRLLENKISELLNRLIAEEKVSLTKELGLVFKIEDVRSRIASFFDNFKVGDLFTEVFEMERNRKILDKQEFYLYFCDITFDKAKYPIFYIPFTVEQRKDTIGIEFDSQVYINKKALGFIVEKYNKDKGTRGSLQSASERIIYLAEHKTDFKDIVDTILNELVNMFELDTKIDITDSKQQTAKSLLVRVSNTSYISLFDKSDEALVNDYEDILRLLSLEDNPLADEFNKLIDDFIHKEPKSFDSEIRDKWDNTETSEKLVFASPIPLNSEQRQILSAVRKDDCKYITVEGPPGTGKSHTITAIVFDAILNDKSTLVLSDKKEALDVVEDKIADTLKSVRTDDRFQNPILRLGKIGSNYSKILSAASINDITNHYNAVKKDYKVLEENIEKLSNTLKDDIEVTIHSYEEIEIDEIHELFDLEQNYDKNGFPIDVSEIFGQPEPNTDLEEFRNIFKTLSKKLIDGTDETNARLLEILNISPASLKTLEKFQDALIFLKPISGDVSVLKDNFGRDISLMSHFTDFTNGDIKNLNKFVSRYDDEKNWLFGYLFKKKKLEEIDNAFKKTLPESTLEHPHEHIHELHRIAEIYAFAAKRNKNKGDEKDLDYIKTIHHILTDGELLVALKELVNLQEDLDYLAKNLGRYPKTIEGFGILPSSLSSLCDNKLTDMDDSSFDELIRYIHLRRKITKGFSDIPSFNYSRMLKDVQNLSTAQMTYMLDGRLISFYQENKATSKVLRDIIRGKKQFPKDEFSKLKEAFPCILAGIRDYAEYIPLEPEIFDLVIIDEASQVSIAQAFPALLRAKKVLIFGDRKQFSNIKSAQARGDTNREYLSSLKDSFKMNVSEKQTELVKLEKFNIKTSILEFFEFIGNYDAQLLKHFRGYKEIISYSNKYFYQTRLQVMKIRAKSISDVIKFASVEDDGKKELIPNTNSLEVNYIISELKKLEKQKSNMSVGIITPHTNQQKMLVDKINQLPERDYFFDKLKLKIMTFDTCQGEERDIIFYSMVATKNDDKLWGVFIKDLSSVNIEEDGKIKAQRLNVGFSRAKEQMHFVLSKDIEDYTGSIGEALRHYQYVLSEAKKERDVSEVDKKSKMEGEVMNWFYQTEFWKKNSDNIEFIPQFEIGKYLRQLDSNYTHPAYKVDFLIAYKDDQHKEHKIVIEYDGFKEHFENIDEVDEFNYKHYYKEDDVYREKVLEGYGYKFLRINKFNIGDDPIATLNKRIVDLLRKNSGGNSVMTHIHETIGGLETGDKKECPKCKEIRNKEDFEDDSLISGYGRICNYCKGIKWNTYVYEKGTTNKKELAAGESVCPKCGKSMVLRTGRYGKFYGCSGYPYCKGTRKY